MKAISIAYIAFHHADDDVGNFLGSKIDWVFTWISLSCFVFVSGYILAKKYKLQTINESISFFKRRFLRLVPLTLIFIIIIALFKFNSHGIDFWLVQALIGVNIFLGKYFIYYWFVSLMMVLYLFYLFVTYKYTLQKFLILSLIILFCISYLPVNQALRDFTPIFFIGIMIGLYNHVYDRFVRFWKLYFLLFVIVVSVFLNTESSNKILQQLFMVLICILPLPALFVFSNYIVNNDFIAKISMVCGEASLCVYLIHSIIFESIYKVVYFHDNILNFIVMFSVGLPISFVIGYYVQFYYNNLLTKIVGIK